MGFGAVKAAELKHTINKVPAHLAGMKDKY